MQLVKKYSRISACLEHVPIHIILPLEKREEVRKLGGWIPRNLREKKGMWYILATRLLRKRNDPFYKNIITVDKSALDCQGWISAAKPKAEMVEWSGYFFHFEILNCNQTLNVHLNSLQLHRVHKIFKENVHHSLIGEILCLSWITHSYEVRKQNID